MLELFYLENELGVIAAKFIADALKANTILKSLEIGCESLFCLFVYCFLGCLFCR